MEGGVPLGLAVISFFNGLEVEGWLNEVRGLWPKIGLEAAESVGGCDIIEGVVDGAELEEGSLKEKFEIGPAEGGWPKVNGVTLVSGAVVEAGFSIVDEGV